MQLLPSALVWNERVEGIPEKVVKWSLSTEEYGYQKIESKVQLLCCDMYYLCDLQTLWGAIIPGDIYIFTIFIYILQF